MSYVPIVKPSAGLAAGLVSQNVVGAGALALPFTSGIRETSYAVTLTQNCVITIGAGTAGLDQVMTIDILQGGSGGYTLSFANVSWSGGIAPSFNIAAGKQDTVQIRVTGSDIMGWPVSMGRIPLVLALPSAPASITVTAGVYQNSVTVPAVTAYPAVSGYNIYSSVAAGAESPVPIASNVNLPFVDGGLTAGVSRFYKVAAVNSLGIGAMSAEASGTPLSGGSVPGVPSSVTAVAGNGQITINATAVAATPAVTGYTIRRGTAAGAEGVAPIASNIALPYIDVDVSNGTTYYYLVAAVNSIGSGPSSIEISATPVAPLLSSPMHYASFTTIDSVFYASPSPVFNPGASPFDMQVYVRMANWANSGYGGSGETCLWGCWDIAVANRLWRLGLTATGAIRASWATGPSANPTAVSSVAIAAAGNSDLWIRAAVTPTTGLVGFYTSPDGAAWTQLGTLQAANSAGGVYSPATLPYLVIGSNGSGGSSGNTAEQFAGRFYEARLYVNGALITDPVVSAGGVIDSKGIGYSKTAGVGIV